MDVLALRCNGRGLVAGGQDHIIRSDLELCALLILYLNAIVQDLTDTGLQMDRNIVCLKEVTQEAGIRQTDTGSGDQIIRISTMVGFLPCRYSS